MDSSAPVLKFNLPTALTLSRVVLIPVFLLLARDHPFWGAAIFAVASLTDYLDGYLARKMGSVTKFGILFDPIADKFLVISALVLLVDMERLSVWIAAALIVREFLVTTLRVVALSRGVIIPAETGGKLKTVAQFTGIICLVMHHPAGSVMESLIARLTGWDLYDLGMVFMIAALVLSVFSGVKYTVAFWKNL
jgi:CDP-diacylglycerol--glycerol-3-phosphate 3-phosphatidyltransferase